MSTHEQALPGVAAPRWGVVAPTYTNAGTLASVLEALDPLGLPIVVVNDGSVDATAQILGDWSAAPGSAVRLVETHERNRGKAAALRSGFQRLRSIGVTHALTFDTDGQLDASDIPEMLRLSSSDPGAMVIGVRDETKDDYPTRSRAGRRLSNFFVRLESGLRVGDSQCGLRVYPLDVMRRLGARGGRYEFETECLTRAGWAGVRVLETPVRCRYALEGGRVSHFRVGADTMRAIVMHAFLLIRSLWPGGVVRIGEAPGTGTIPSRLVRWLNPMRALRQARADGAGRRSIASALALGVFIANLPIYGFQTIASLACARRFGLHPLVVVAGAHVSTPPIGPALIALAIGVGHLVLWGSWPSLNAIASDGIAEFAGSLLLEWAVGSVIVGAAMAAATYLGALATLGLLVGRGRSEDGDAPADQTREDRSSAPSTIIR